LGFPAGSAEGSADHQFPLRGASLSERALPHSGVALFEFTGTKSPKSKWKFTKPGEDWFCFAGLWRPMPDGGGEAFTLLTTEPGPDVAPIHDRQMVVLDRPDWLAWLDLTRPESELLRPLPPGRLTVEQVR
jgi:putative SOS response-associated peptidase YedK